jgi:cytochrome c biogenesis factor
MRSLAIALEAVGIVAIIIGIAIESVFRAEIGFITITGGSAFIAAGGLIWAKLVKKNKR